MPEPQILRPGDLFPLGCITPLSPVADWLREGVGGGGGGLQGFSLVG